MKEKNKTKQNFKTILAAPTTSKCDTLSEDEILKLENLFRAAIESSGKDARHFPAAHKVHLGMSSSLRAIQANEFSCVFISLSLRPSHLITLMARSAELKDETAPVYAQHKLEEITERLFGVRALTLVLPKSLETCSAELAAWVSKRRKPKKIKVELKPQKRKRKIKVMAKTEEKPIEVVKKQKTEETLPVANELKNWDGDFISFANTSRPMQLDELDIAEDEHNLKQALSKLTQAAAEKSKVIESVENNAASLEVVELNEPGNDSGSDADDFLAHHYVPLTVHRICPNPNKKGKKKNKKNKVKQNVTKS